MKSEGILGWNGQLLGALPANQENEPSGPERGVSKRLSPRRGSIWDRCSRRQLGMRQVLLGCRTAPPAAPVPSAQSPQPTCAHVHIQLLQIRASYSCWRPNGRLWRMTKMLRASHTMACVTHNGAVILRGSPFEGSFDHQSLRMCRICCHLRAHQEANAMPRVQCRLQHLTTGAL